MNRNIHPSTIKSHLVPAIFVSLFLFPTAFFAIREAKKCNEALADNNWEAAQKYSRNARNWILISAILGIAILGVLAWVVYMLWPHFVQLWDNIRFIMSDDYPVYYNTE